MNGENQLKTVEKIVLWSEYRENEIGEKRRNVFVVCPLTPVNHLDASALELNHAVIAGNFLCFFSFSVRRCYEGLF